MGHIISLLSPNNHYQKIDLSRGQSFDLIKNTKFLASAPLYCNYQDCSHDLDCIFE